MSIFLLVNLHTKAVIETLPRMYPWQQKRAMQEAAKRIAAPVALVERTEEGDHLVRERFDPATLYDCHDRRSVYFGRNVKSVERLVAESNSGRLNRIARAD